ncbi:MAG: hypothetical protein IJZ86_09250, partial [Bacteroides sp.]|nr:hypothetical protein [Bacteroides sp.]
MFILQLLLSNKLRFLSHILDSRQNYEKAFDKKQKDRNKKFYGEKKLILHQNNTQHYRQNTHTYNHN